MFFPFKPAKPELAQAFMESVQPVSPSILSQMGETATKITNALGSFASTIFGGIIAIPKGALYAMANVAAVPSVFLNRTASILDRTQNAVHSVFAGK